MVRCSLRPRTPSWVGSARAIRADFPVVLMGAPSSLEGAGHEAANEMALEKQKQNQARQRHHDDAGFRRAIVDRPHRLLAEVGDGERQGLLRRVVEQDERGEKIVPRRKEGEHGDGNQTGPYRGNENAPEHAERAAAVHEGGFVKFARHGLERDAHHVGGEGELEHGEHEAEAEERVLQSDAVQQYIERNEDGGVRRHENRERQQEDEVAAGKVKAGECVAAEAGHHKRDRDHQEGDHRAVEEEARQSRAEVEERIVIAETHADRLAGCGLWTDGRDGRPQDREQENDRKAACQDIVGGPAEGVAMGRAHPRQLLSGSRSSRNWTAFRTSRASSTTTEMAAEVPRFWRWNASRYINWPT